MTAVLCTPNPEFGDVELGNYMAFARSEQCNQKPGGGARGSRCTRIPTISIDLGFSGGVKDFPRIAKAVRTQLHHCQKPAY
jgi:hypothetical protein